MRPGKAITLGAIIDAALCGELDEARARQLHTLGAEAVALVLLAISKRVVEQNARIAELEGQSGSDASSPSTPSSMVPVYEKPSVKKRRKTPGAQEGHPGRRREKPKQITHRREHRLKRCPHCDGPLQRCDRTRTRTTEDIPETVEPEVTEHTIHRDYCPNCKTHVEPVVPNAMPGATLGHHVIALTAWLHYGLGVTIAQIVSILGYHFQTKLTPGGLVNAWQRLAEVLTAWYDQIGEQAKQSARLHADETGWRVNGVTYWLWCFANTRTCYYVIDRSRGSPVLQKFFTDVFEGVLVTDFWAPYLSVCANDRQYCLGKSLITLDAAARVSRGLAWPDTPGCPNTSGDVIILSAEDDPADTIRPRLDVAGADVSRIHVLTTVQRDNGSLAPFSLERDLPLLEDAIREVQGCRLLVIDPVSAYLGRTDSHKNADIRGLIAPLAELASRHRVAIVAVTHLNKGAGTKAVYRATGSLAFIAAARAAFLVIADEQDRSRRLMLPAKMNVGPNPMGLAFTVGSRKLAGIGSVGYISWETEPVWLTANEALAMEAGSATTATKPREAAVEWLQELLLLGPLSANEVRAQANEAGLFWGTVRRAQAALGIKPGKSDFGGPWMWELPGEDAHTGDQDAQLPRVSNFGESEHLGEREVVKL